MADEQPRSNNDELRVKIPVVGIDLVVKGREILFVLVVAGMVASLAYVNHMGFKAIETHIQAQSNEHGGLIKELRIHSWLLSLPTEKRPELVPPEEIWDRLRDPNWTRKPGRKE